MRILSVGRRCLRRGRRAVSMLEFVILLPLMVFIMLFLIDMGSVVLANGAMQDVAYSASRTGAQVGGGALISNGTYPCGRTTTSFGCGSGASYTAFTDSLKQTPDYVAARTTNPQMRLRSGGKCVAAAVGSRTDNHVSAQVRYQQKLITPGLGALLSAAGATVKNGNWELTVSASSRCEVVR